MQISTITTKGQATIPVEVRKALHLKAGDRVQFQREGDRYFIKSAPSRVEDAFGIIKVKKGISLDEMDQAGRQAMLKKHGRHKA